MQQCEHAATQMGGGEGHKWEVVRVRVRVGVKVKVRFAEHIDEVCANAREFKRKLTFSKFSENPGMRWSMLGLGLGLGLGFRASFRVTATLRASFRVRVVLTRSQGSIEVRGRAAVRTCCDTNGRWRGTQMGGGEC